MTSDLPCSDSSPSSLSQPCSLCVTAFQSSTSESGTDFPPHLFSEKRQTLPCASACTRRTYSPISKHFIAQGPRWDGPFCEAKGLSLKNSSNKGAQNDGAHNR